MIALILADRCIGCNACVEVCPTLVFDAARDEADAVPGIARADACQTCYLCELYCPADAIYVAPHQFVQQHVSPEEALASGQLGRLRRDSGWDEVSMGADLDLYRLLGPLLNQGAEIAAARGI